MFFSISTQAANATNSISWLGPPLLAAALTQFIAILLWLAKEWRTDQEARSKTAVEKEKFLRALYAEIDFNTADMEVFLEFSASVGETKDKIRDDPNFIPHITDSRHMEIYKTQISLLHHAGDDYIADVVLFYGVMEKIRAEVNGVYLASYKTISADGRASVIDDIVEYSVECAELGQSILREMEQTYPVYRLKRKKRKAPEKISSADLEQKMQAFVLDLDRARSAHGRDS